MTEQSDIQQTITEAQYAATSARGSAVINITNYYYREDVAVTPVKLADPSADENLSCPYQGLFHFDPKDAEFFFGREVFVEELVLATATRSFIPILGASGSGKSSVVLAGLVPKLQQDGHWKFTHFRPGSDPFQALAEALVPLYEPEKNATEQIHQARQLAEYFVNGSVPLKDVFARIKRNHPNNRVLLIADQFEELYTLCSNEKIRRSFLDTLLAGFQSFGSNFQSSPMLVATMRADFLANALLYRPFADVLQNADIKLGAMNRSELSQVIEKPAQKLGVTFQDGLVERILDDVEDEPGNLPMLEFALTQQEHQKRRLVFFVILVVLLVLVTFVSVLWSKEQQTRTVLARSLINQAELTRKQDNNLQISVALAIEAINQSPSEASEGFMYNALPLLPRSKPPIIKHKSGVNVIAFSPKGTYLATAGWKSIAEQDGKIDSPANTCVWEPARHKLLNGKPNNCLEHKDNVNAVAFSPDEKYLATASLDGKACVWEIISRKEIWCKDYKNGLKVGANAVSFSPDGKYLAIAEADGKVFVFKTNGYGLINSTKHKGSVLAMTFSPDGQYLATASLDGTVRVWHDWKLRNSSKEPVKLIHSGPVTDVAFSPDSKYIATASGRIAKVWEINTGNSVKELIKHDKGVLAVTFSQNGQYVATASLDGTVRVWHDWKLRNSSKEPVKLIHGGPVADVVFSPDSKYIATASSDSTARVWDATSGDEFTRLIHKDGVNAIAFSPDKKFLLATASLDGTARVWEINSDRTVALMRHNTKVNAMALSNDGKHIATASNDETVRVWSATSGYQELVLRPQGGSVMVVTFSQNGKYLAALSSNNKVTVWDVVSDQQIWHSPPEKNVNSVAFSPDGKYLATTSSYYAELWSIPDGKKIHKHPMEHKQYITSVVFSQDSKYLTTASRDNTACVWDVSTGQKVMPCVEHPAFVEAVAFNQDKDRKLLATASRDGTVKVSEIPNGKNLYELSL